VIAPTFAEYWSAAAGQIDVRHVEAAHLAASQAKMMQGAVSAACRDASRRSFCAIAVASRATAPSRCGPAVLRLGKFQMSMRRTIRLSVHPNAISARNADSCRLIFCGAGALQIPGSQRGTAEFTQQLIATYLGTVSATWVLEMSDYPAVPRYPYHHAQCHHRPRAP
jgi:hypothetical protein